MKVILLEIFRGYELKILKSPRKLLIDNIFSHIC